MPVPIVYVDNSKVFSGAEVGLLELLLTLDRERFSSSVLLPYPQSHQARYNEATATLLFRAHKLTWWMGSDRWQRPVRGADFAKRIVLGLRLQRILRRCNARICHLNLTWPSSLMDICFARGTGAKVVAHVRSFTPTFRLPAHLLKRCHAVICMSDLVLRNVTSWHPQVKAIRIYDPIHADRYNFSPGKAEAKRRLGTLPNRRLVCSVGLLIDHKGHDIAIEAFSRVAQEHRDVDLMIVGGTPDGKKNGDELKRLKRLAEVLGIQSRVMFTDGHVPHIEVVYAAAEFIYALSKDGEAFGRVALEVGAAGRTIVATNIGATPELVCSEVNGILVPPGDVGATSAASRALLTSPDQAKVLGLSAERHVRECFAPKVHALQVQELYEELLTGVAK